MGRTVEGLDGLAIRGTASVGPLRFPVPTVAWTVRPSDSRPAPPHLRLLVSPGAHVPIGRRSVELRSGDDRLLLEFPVPVPEVSGITGSIHEAAQGAWIVHWPLSPEQWEALAGARPQMVILGNAHALLRDGEPFVRSIRELRTHLGGAPVLWAPRVALPHRLALLAYLGVDLVDTTEARWQAAGGTVLDATLGSLSSPSVRRSGLCDCTDCCSDERSSGSHVAVAMERELALVTAASLDGRLRELVEVRLTAEPLIAELLRYLDRDLAELLEERTPVVGHGVRGYVLRESQRRPEVRRFLDRLLSRYRPPPSKEVLLLLPCSKTKPYRSSPSHRRYLGALEGLPNLARLHVASVTSPLGIVPRELEDVYPARHYDLPVTGEWDEEERRRVVAAAEHLRRTGRYRRIVFHLDPVEYSFLRSLPGAPESLWSAPDDRTLSPEALDSLRTAVEDGLRDCPPVPGGPLTVVKEELHEVAAFQFGRPAADRLFSEPVRLAGRPWFQRIVDGDRVDLASWKDERGLFQLTVAGGRRLLEAHSLHVEVSAGVTLLGDLFTPGVAHADPDIRVGDAVVLVRDGGLLGVGEAELPGRLMSELDHGLAVTVRHRARPQLEPQPTST